MTSGSSSMPISSKLLGPLNVLWSVRPLHSERLASDFLSLQSDPSKACYLSSCRRSCLQCWRLSFICCSLHRTPLWLLASPVTEDSALLLPAWRMGRFSSSFAWHRNVFQPDFLHASHCCCPSTSQACRRTCGECYPPTSSHRWKCHIITSNADLSRHIWRTFWIF